MQRLFRQSVLLSVALFSIQGTIYLYQLVAASILLPEIYSLIRVIESISALGSMLVTFGLPSVTLVQVTALNDDRSRRTFLISGALLLACLFAIFCAVSFAAIKLNLIGGEFATAIGYAAPIVLAMSLRLFLSSILQADQRLTRLAGSAVASCIASYALAIGLYFMGVDPVLSWVSARLALEIILCLFLAASEIRLRAGNPGASRMGSVIPDSSLSSLARTALPIGLSLAARSLVENGPILFLSATGVTATVIAQVGLAITIIGIAAFPAAIVQTTLIPRMARRLRTSDSLIYAAVAWLAAVALSVALLLFITMIAARQQQWAGFLSWQTVSIIALVLVVKVIAGACGGVLLLLGRGPTILLINGLTLIWGIAACLVLPILGDMNDTVRLLQAILAVEALAMCIYLVVATYRARQAKSL